MQRQKKITVEEKKRISSFVLLERDGGRERDKNLNIGKLHSRERIFFPSSILREREREEGREGGRERERRKRGRERGRGGREGGRERERGGREGGREEEEEGREGESEGMGRDRI